MPTKTRNSAMKPEVSGKPKLAKIKINKNMESNGILVITLLKYKIFLVPNLSYNIPIAKNKPAEITPWLIIKNIESKIVITILSFAIILFIGMIDYITGAEISFSIFYLIPIILIALYKQVKKNVVIINAIFASVVWFVADFYARKYSNVSIPIWNAIVRLSIFVLVGLLVLNYKEKYKKLIQANKDLVRLNAEKNKFIGIAAHD